MKNSNGSVVGKWNTAKISALMLVAGALAFASQAQVVLLQDGNSQARVDLGSDRGMFEWAINGTAPANQQLNQQWFWYRIGNTAERPINTIAAQPVQYMADGGQLSATYFGAGFSVTIDYTLSGGMAGGNDWTSDIAESIKIHNGTAGPLEFHFFQYSDFD